MSYPRPDTAVLSWIRLPCLVRDRPSFGLNCSLYAVILTWRCVLSQVSRVLDPLLETLAYFETPGDLKRRTHDLFSALDVEAKGLIGYTELCNGLRRLQVLFANIL